MAKIPPPSNTIAALIDAAHEKMREDNDEPREHLGCSMAGHPCDRWLWLSFRWAVRQKIPGRTLRIFRRGQDEEATFVRDLRMIGVDIHETGIRQRRISFGWHTGGSIDGIIEGGVPGAERKRHIAEFKTMNTKNFAKLSKEGVEKAQPTHFVQMQLYMLATGIDRALYVVVNKDDDSLYSERVRFDATVAEKYRDRMIRIAQTERMPPPISTDPSWFQCKFCPAYEFCHDYQLTKQTNCRTCAHATPRENDWHCARWDDAIPVEAQRSGCRSHVLHPDLVPWKMKEAESEWEVIYLIDGTEVRNGETGYSSAEIIANPLLCSMNDPLVESLRQEFGGEVVG